MPVVIDYGVPGAWEGAGVKQDLLRFLISPMGSNDFFVSLWRAGEKQPPSISILFWGATVALLTQTKYTPYIDNN